MKLIKLLLCVLCISLSSQSGAVVSAQSYKKWGNHMVLQGFDVGNPIIALNNFILIEGAAAYDRKQKDKTEDGLAAVYEKIRAIDFISKDGSLEKILADLATKISERLKEYTATNASEIEELFIAKDLDNIEKTLQTASMEMLKVSTYQELVKAFISGYTQSFHLINTYREGTYFFHYKGKVFSPTLKAKVDDIYIIKGQFNVDTLRKLKVLMQNNNINTQRFAKNAQPDLPGIIQKIDTASAVKEKIKLLTEIVVACLEVANVEDNNAYQTSIRNFNFISHDVIEPRIKAYALGHDTTTRNILLTIQDLCETIKIILTELWYDSVRSKNAHQPNPPSTTASIYELLGVDKSANKSALQKAFRKLAGAAIHPDRVSTLKKNAIEEMLKSRTRLAFRQLYEEKLDELTKGFKNDFIKKIAEDSVKKIEQEMTRSLRTLMMKALRNTYNTDQQFKDKLSSQINAKKDEIFQVKIDQDNALEANQRKGREAIKKEALEMAVEEILEALNDKEIADKLKKERDANMKKALKEATASIDDFLAQQAVNEVYKQLQNLIEKEA